VANARVAVRHRGVLIRAGDAYVVGDLVVPSAPIGGVILSRGRGPHRPGLRIGQVARALQEGQLATLLVDLLNEAEARDPRNVFDVALLASRLAAASEFLGRSPETASFLIGYFGAGTRAAAVLWAAVEPGARAAAIVSCGGRLDLAGPRLGAVTAPTLLIVGGEDPLVLALNQQARRALACPTELVIVPGSTHRFQEPGALAQLAELAQGWYVRYLGARVAGAA
jgi:putative phosphoribosyl transferase